MMLAPAAYMISDRITACDTLIMMALLAGIVGHFTYVAKPEMPMPTSSYCPDQAGEHEPLMTKTLLAACAIGANDLLRPSSHK